MSGKAPSVDEDYSDFLPWLERKAGEKISSTLSIGKSLHGGRRGLLASENIKKGDRMLKIPHSVQLARDNLPLELNSLFGNNIDNFSAVAVLVLREENLGQNSEWAPYISRLPLPQDLHSPVFWSDEELEMIRPCSLYETTLTRRKVIERDFLFVKFVLQDTTTLEKFTYAYQLVRSRAWVTTKRGVILIPFADFINHDTSSGANLVEHESHSEIIADRDYAAGDEVVITYGNYSNTKLLLSYGFTIPDNPYDFDLVSLSSLAQHGKELGSIKIKSMEDISPSLRAFARTLVCRFRQDVVEDKEREIAAHQLLHDEISKLLIKKRDEHMMKLVESSVNVVVRKQLAVQLLEGEVRVLEYALTWLENYCSTLRTN